MPAKVAAETGRSVSARKPQGFYGSEPAQGWKKQISLVASRFPGRKLMIVSDDSAYGGASVLRKLPPNIELISHVHPKGALYEPAPDPIPGKKGAHPKMGKRLPDMASWANDGKQPWRKLVFDQFGLHATLMVKTMQALYYKAGKDRLLTKSSIAKKVLAQIIDFLSLAG